MNAIKDNKVRILYALASLLIIITAQTHKDEVIASTNLLNEFSYIGGVATLIGLMITTLEIAHSI